MSGIYQPFLVDVSMNSEVLVNKESQGFSSPVYSKGK